MQVVDGESPLIHVRVRIDAPDDQSVIGRTTELVTDDDGAITLPDLPRGSSFAVTVPEISPESHIFTVPTEKGAVRWRITPREWAPPRASAMAAPASTVQSDDHHVHHRLLGERLHDR
jgi:hypothetical protein